MAASVCDAATDLDDPEKIASLIRTSDTDSALYGVVDIGSNGIRCSISDLSAPYTRLLRCVHRDRAALSLYDALLESLSDAESPRFSKQTITEVTATLSRFRAICDEYGVPSGNIIIFATEAMRTSKNRDELLQAVHRATGLTISILSPRVECLLGAMGARSAFHRVDGIFMDLGGGSVQITYMNSEEQDYPRAAAERARSLPFGAARLTSAMSNEGTSKSTINELSSTIKESYDQLKEHIPRLQEQERNQGIKLYLCGGGFRGYGSMLMHTVTVQAHPIPLIDGYAVSGARFGQWQEALQANSQHGKIFGMSKRRRKQFPAIVEVIKAMVTCMLNIREVVFCAGGNREGCLYLKLPEEIRETDPALCPSVGGARDDGATLR